MSNFTIPTIAGWILANIPNLYTMNVLKLDDKINELEKNLDDFANPPRIINLRNSVRKKLFSAGLIFTHLINISVLVILVLLIFLEPATLLARFIPQSISIKWNIYDRLAVSLMFLIQFFFFVGRGISPWINGLRLLKDAREWLKERGY